MQRYQVKTEFGEVPVHVLHPDAFGGEYEKRSGAYIAFLTFAALYSCAVNFSQALFRKILNGWRDVPLGRVLWEIGRDPKHFSCFFCDRFSRHKHRAKWGAAGWQLFLADEMGIDCRNK